MRGAGVGTGVAVLALSGAVLAAGAASPGPPGAAALHAEGPPAGHTGGFGEPTCQACHAEYPLDVDGRLEVKGFPERYEPGRRYPVTLVLESAGMERAGFQAAVRWDEGAGSARRSPGTAPGTPAGTAEAADGSVVIRHPWIQHAPGGKWTDGAERTSWSFVWIAPEEAGPVVVHVAANSADGDDSPFGDIVYTATARSTAIRP